MAVGIPTVEDVPVAGVTPDKPRVRLQVSYSQLLRVLERWRRRYYGWDYRETMVKLVVRATVPYERSSGVGMMPEIYDQRLGVPKGDSPTCLLTMVKGEGRRRQVIYVRVARSRSAVVSSGLTTVLRTEPDFDFRVSDGSQAD